MVKVKPANGEHTEDIKGSRATLLVWSVVYRVSWFFGLIAIQKTKTGPHHFKLFSWSSLFTLMRLVVFSFPFVVLPYILSRGGFLEEEWKTLIQSLRKNATAGAGNLKGSSLQDTRKIVIYMNYFSNYFLFALPFLFAHYMTAPLENMLKIVVFEENILTQEKGMFQLTKPIFGFILFVFGAVAIVVEEVVKQNNSVPGYINLPLNMYATFGFNLLSFIGLQFSLAMYEFYFYNNCHDFNDLVRKALTTGEKESTFETVKQLFVFMESFQKCFGVFLLVDLSLMFLYWLIHLYDAYFTFQEGPLAACGSVLIIAAELWRVVLISEAGQQFTEKTNDVVSKLEDMRLTLTDKGDRQVDK